MRHASAPFAIERHPVTNAQFSEFIAETGYLTVAERPLEPTLFPEYSLLSDLDPGALVFRSNSRAGRSK